MNLGGEPNAVGQRILISRFHKQREAFLAATTALGQGAAALEEKQLTTLVKMLEKISRVRQVFSWLQDCDLNLANCSPMI